ncbi:hypothetical protein ACFFKU_10235 [Kineococcus gynurae]|uniref:Uncharacterized protein n=1 Tax=Kineococcus gynurae TaxID=452979 RepID=A0ABV5LV41_9ACTN
MIDLPPAAPPAPAPRPGPPGVALVGVVPLAALALWALGTA